jgi:pyruvate/2-oxoglutarate dehydrogenase complex dihydrolipoamide dehydrogenase (E3) component
MANRRYDPIVIGSGPAGQKGAISLHSTVKMCNTLGP